VAALALLHAITGSGCLGESARAQEVPMTASEARLEPTDHQSLAPPPPPPVWTGEPDVAPHEPDPAECTGKLVISEVHFDPEGTAEGLGEYVELWNPGPDPVDLRGWSLDNGRRQKRTFEGPTPLLIEPGQACIVAASLEADENGDLTALADLGKLSLANRGGLLHLRNPCGESEVRFRYARAAPWPKVRPGTAIELRAADADPSLGRSWRPARARTPSGDRGSPNQVPDGWKAQVPGPSAAPPTKPAVQPEAEETTARVPVRPP
jgi:hypothetical protein